MKLRVEITQSEVDGNFVMFVPVFADFGKGMVRLGQIPIALRAALHVVLSQE